jgi:hypothetical protein
MPKPPLTQKQIQKKKARKEKEERKEVIIINTSQQMVPIHVRASEGVDFYVGEQSIHLRPKQKHRFPVHRLYSTQISRLQKRRAIQVIKISSGKAPETPVAMAAVAVEEDVKPRAKRVRKDEPQGQTKVTKVTKKKTVKNKSKEIKKDISKEDLKDSGQDSNVSSEGSDI